MKILIYGFKPYKKWKENIAEKIISKVRKRENLEKLIFPVKFKKEIFLEKIKKSKPDIILGLGQAPRSRKIRIEKRAVNLKKYNKKEKPKIIFRNKPKYLFVNLKLKKDNSSRISYDAGKYVCNFSMYVISDYCKNKNIKFTFIHIPKNYNLNKATKFIESKINEVYTTTHSYNLRRKQKEAKE